MLVACPTAAPVAQVLCRRSGAHVVLKVYAKKRLDHLTRRHLEREISVHSALCHDNAVELYAAFEDGAFVALVLEYAGGGDLLAFMCKCVSGGRKGGCCCFEA
eukprot:362907-Chlamydomonas_euryale.AAC.8